MAHSYFDVTKALMRSPTRAAVAGSNKALKEQLSGNRHGEKTAMLGPIAYFDAYLVWHRAPQFSDRNFRKLGLGIDL